MLQVCRADFLCHSVHNYMEHLFQRFTLPPVWEREAILIFFLKGHISLRDHGRLLQMDENLFLSGDKTSFVVDPLELGLNLQEQQH